jgi:hypothetical protein
MATGCGDTEIIHSGTGAGNVRVDRLDHNRRQDYRIYRMTGLNILGRWGETDSLYRNTL